MKHITFFNTFNESLSSDSGLKFNIRSTTDGYKTLKNDDPTIPMGSERDIDKLIITNPRELFNYQYSDQKDNETRSSLDSENILRIRIGGRDFVGRSGGVTHIALRVPDNFNYAKFENEIPKIRHRKTSKEDVSKAIEELENLIISCIGGDSGFTQATNHAESSMDLDYARKIIELINPIKEAIGTEKTKKILLDIASQL